MVTTDNMGLLLPTVQVTPGPTYGTENNDAFTTIDEHDHSTGKGIAIKPSGLNINSDLSIQSNDLTNVNAVALDNLSAPETNVSRVNQSGGDLYWTNAGGTAVQITSGASVNSSSSGISRSFSPSAISSNTVIGASDTFSYYLVNTGASVTFTLPAANGVSSGRFYEFKDVTGGAATHNITLTPDGTDTIDGQSSYTINVPYGQVRIVSDGTSKWNLNQFPITASKAAVSDSTGKVVASATTATEIGYVAGVTSAIQTQINSLIAQKISRPSFNWNSSDTSQIIIPASVAKPAIVKIAGAYYTNTTDLILDLDTSGANGLDTGTKAANTIYYVYAILPSSGSTFRGCLSVTPPSTGPTGFSSNWSYLGSCGTSSGSSNFEAFSFSNGILTRAASQSTVTVTSSSVSSKTIKVSTIAFFVYLRSVWTAVNAAGDNLELGPTSGFTTVVSNANSASASLTMVGQHWVPITESTKVYAKVTSNSDSVSLLILSWQENPMDFQ